MRKHLFVVFTDDSCRQNHALMYALELHTKGHHVRLLLEGTGTRALSEMTNPDSRLGAKLKEARDRLREEMLAAADNLEFEKAAVLRDEMLEIEKKIELLEKVGT